MEHLEAQVITQLLTEWQQPQQHLTTVGQAMAALGLADDQELRWRVGQKVRRLWRRAVQDPGRYARFRMALGLAVDEARTARFLQQTRAWSPASYILNEEEKLVARAILLSWERDRRLPSVEEIAQAAEQTLAQVTPSLEMLARVGFLASMQGPPAGYRLARGYRRFLQGLGLSFHTVTLASGKRFNVP